jgi:hypothetical protein
VLPWAGDIDDLKKIIAIFRDLENLAISDLTTEFSSGRARRKEKFSERYSWLSSEDLEAGFEEKEKDTLDEEILALSLTMRTKEKKFSRTNSGNPDLVIHDVDLSDVEEIRLELGKSYTSPTQSASIDFDPEFGVQFRAQGKTDNWVVIATSKIESVLKSQRPKYWWLYRKWLSIPLLSILL